MAYLTRYGNLTVLDTAIASTINGNVDTDTLTVTSDIALDGNDITGANVISANTVTLTGNITATNIGNITSVNLSGNASQVLLGNGAFGTVSAASGNLQSTLTIGNTASIGITLSGSATYTGNGSGLTDITGANVTGTVANATVAASANSVSLANVAGIGNIASVNLDGNVSNVLAGNGTWIAMSGGGGGGTPAGSTGSFQYNDSNSFGGIRTDILEVTTANSTLQKVVTRFGIAEYVPIYNQAPSINENIFLGENNIKYFTVEMDIAINVNFTWDETPTTLDTGMDQNQMLSATLMLTIGQTPYNITWSIDDTDITPLWLGGTPIFYPNSVMIFNLHILKTDINQFQIFGTAGRYI